MDRIIKSISEIESKSVKIMDDSNAQKAAIFAQIQAEATNFNSGLEAETNRKIEALRAQLEKNMSEKLEKQSGQAAFVLATLHAHYEQFHSDYVNRMFEEMTGA